MRPDARWAVLLTLAFVVATVVPPLTWWRATATLGLILAFFVGLAGLPPGQLARRGLALLPLLGFLALVVAPSHPARGDLGLAGVVGAILARNGLAIGATMVLAHAVPMPRLLAALRRLGMPPILLSTLHFMHRYLEVLADELARMAQARRARSFRRSGRLDWGLLTGLLGILLIRALERGERVHAAMLARGWDGTFRTLDGADGR